jgi:hypothetical protein
MMTSNYPSGTPSGGGTDRFSEDPLGDTSTLPETGQSDTGKSSVTQQASELSHEAAGAGQHVAGVAADQTKRVAAEAGSQARNLVHEVGYELRDQAANQQTRVAEGLRSVGDELRSMADKSDEPGMATDMVRQVAGRVNSAAQWLDARDPGSLLGEVKNFARQRPGVFIAIAVGAGALAGRLTRAIASPPERNDDQNRYNTMGSSPGMTGVGTDTGTGIGTGIGAGGIGTGVGTGVGAGVGTGTGADLGASDLGDVEVDVTEVWVAPPEGRVGDPGTTGDLR